MAQADIAPVTSVIAPTLVMLGREGHLETCDES